MRIALAQLNPISGDIDGNAAALDPRRSTKPRGRGADIVVTPEMVVPGYCIGDLVEDRGFLEANERAMQRIARRRRAASPPSSASSTATTRPAATPARSASTTPRRSCATAGCCSARASRCCRTTATSTTSGSSRRPSDREPVDVGAAVRRARASACRSARTCGTSSTTSSRCRSSPPRAPGVILNLNASPFYPGQAARARRADPPPHPPGPQADRLRQHRRARPTTARTSSRSTARAWSTTRTRGWSRSAGSSRRTC